MRIIVVLMILLLRFSSEVYAWGKTGHDAVAYIAECNLSPVAKKNIEKYLRHSIVYYASWMDEYRSTAEYKHTTGWHGAPVDESFCYTDALRREKGDVISELENAIELLRDYQNLSDSTVAVNLKYVIHMVGDMHCPVHIQYPNLPMRYNITLNGKEYKYHSVWDTQVLEFAHNWNYMEWQHQLDRCSSAEKAEIAAGSPRDWFHESAVDCRKIYDMAPANSIQGKDFLNAAHPLAESQILKAGYRLARILNELFSDSVYTLGDTVAWTLQKARQWVKQGEWNNEWKILPHQSTDYIEFASQYNKNKELWDKTFSWLATHDLLNMPAGSYEIDGKRSYISIQDAETQDASERKIESHRQYIDLQYVVKGKERFGLTSAEASEPVTEYKAEKDNQFHKAERIKYVDSTPDCFFLFFPKNYHQPLVKAGKKSEKVRVVVAKIEYQH